MQFWRELPAAEQAAALATWPTRAELVAANVAATPSSQNVAATPSSPKTQTKIAVPPSMPEGADNCDGASLPPQQDKIVLATERRRYVISAGEFDLGSLVVAAANEVLGEEPYSNQTVAQIHLMLRKPERTDSTAEVRAALAFNAKTQRREAAKIAP